MVVNALWYKAQEAFFLRVGRETMSDEILSGSPDFDFHFFRNFEKGLLAGCRR